MLKPVRSGAEGCQGPEEAGIEPTEALAERRDGNPPTHGQGMLSILLNSQANSFVALSEGLLRGDK